MSMITMTMYNALSEEQCRYLRASVEMEIIQAQKFRKGTETTRYSKSGSLDDERRHASPKSILAASEDAKTQAGPEADLMT